MTTKVKTLVTKRISKINHKSPKESKLTTIQVSSYPYIIIRIVKIKRRGQGAAETEDNTEEKNGGDKPTGGLFKMSVPLSQVGKGADDKEKKPTSLFGNPSG